MRMLNGTLVLHGVDVERLASEVCREWVGRNRAHGSNLSESRQEDLVAFLVSETWRISLKYDPERNPRFRSYASPLLFLRCVDWLRQDEGRTRWQFAGHVYERERPTLVSLDSTDRDQLGPSFTNPQGGDHQDRDSFGSGMEDHGDRTRDRDLDLIRAAATRRAA